MDKELSTWSKFGAVRGAARDGANVVNVLRVRWILTRTEDGTAEARLVVLGYQDKQPDQLKSASSTASRLARNNFLLVAASRRWFLLKGDVKSSFLQADAVEEAREVLIDPNPELRDHFELSEDFHKS